MTCTVFLGLDNLWRINIAGIWVPMGTLALVALLCVVLH